MFTKEILYLKCRKLETLEYKDKRTKNATVTTAQSNKEKNRINK